MNRARPEEINQAMRATQVLLDAGMAFVPIPVRDEAHRKELVALGSSIIQELISKADKEESNG